MYQKNDPLWKHLRQQVRNESTYYEKLMWEQLRQRRFLGLKFRRNQQIGRYYVDFCCPSQKIVIEIDGSVHAKDERIEYDYQRDAYLKSLGYRVFRFSNDRVQWDMPSILEELGLAESASPPICNLS